MPNEEKTSNPGLAGDPPQCPVNPKWLEGMLAVLPPGLAGRLEPYRSCVVERKPPVEEAPAEEVPAEQ